MEYPRVKSKENGFILAVDPASNNCGVSLWKDGAFCASRLLQSHHYTDPFSVRMQTILNGLESFLIVEMPPEAKVHTIITEGVRSRMLQTCIGSLIVSKYIYADLSPKTSFVEPQQWKSWAKKHGANCDPIKGIPALRGVGWDMKKFPVTSDDEADSILLYLTWRDRP
jgi:hypothetical protein